MHELITRALYYLHVHLLYASIVWLAAWVLTSIGPGSATVKYWIWVATSLNFIVPVGAVVDKIGAYRFSWAAPLGAVGAVANDISRSPAAPALAAVWLVGAIAMFRRVLRRILAERRADGDRFQTAAATTAFRAQGVPVKFAASRQTPAVSGVLRPQISLPDGIERLLNADELDAVIAHEVIHARRRDNLIRLVHEIGVCMLWFHPLVWITGSRITLYRELSCDEGVIRKSRGADLISALAKFANPEATPLLQATASSFIGVRLARLATPPPRWKGTTVSALLILVFGAVLLGGVSETVAHTACCFVAKPAAGGGRPVGARTARTSVPTGGVEGGIAGGIQKGIRRGIRGGIQAGIRGGIAGGVPGGVRTGVEGGVAGGIRAEVR